jgi:hypothetical protein
VYFDNDPDMLNIAVDDHWHDLLVEKTTMKKNISRYVAPPHTFLYLSVRGVTNIKLFFLGK